MSKGGKKTWRHHFFRPHFLLTDHDPDFNFPRLRKMRKSHQGPPKKLKVLLEADGEDPQGHGPSDSEGHDPPALEKRRDPIIFLPTWIKYWIIFQ